VRKSTQDRDKIPRKYSKNCGCGIEKKSVQTDHVNVTDIKDESGYIRSFRKEAAAKSHQ